MKHSLLVVAITAAFVGCPVLADGDSTLETRVQRLEQLLGHLQGRVDQQDQTIANQDQTIRQQGTVIERQADIIDGQQKQLTEGTAQSSGGWFQNIEIGGLVEVEANYVDPYTGPGTGRSTSDLTLATVEVGISSQVNNWTRADIILLHEEDEENNHLIVDVGTITHRPTRWKLVRHNRSVLCPFWHIESHMISDPLTLEIGETRESALQVGMESGPLNGSVYLFNGTNKQAGGTKDRIDNWGANLGVSHESDGLTASGGIGFINDIGDSDGIQGGLTTNNVRDHVPGWTANAIAEVGNFVFIGEFVGATEDFQPGELMFKGRGAEPRAWNAEAGFNFPMMGRDSTVAIAYQGTRESLALGWPRRRMMVGWSVSIFENTALTFEWAHDKDYSSSDGGTGENANTVTTQLAVEFP